jgi:hypothetical protein
MQRYRTGASLPVAAWPFEQLLHGRQRGLPPTIRPFKNAPRAMPSTEQKELR